MSELQLWTLEQSTLGNGKTTCDNASLEELVTWARAEASEPVPSLAWRTELALFYMNTDQLDIQERCLQRVVVALGYRTTDAIPKASANAIQFGVVPLSVGERTLIHNAHRKRSYKISSQPFGVVWSWDPAQRRTKGIMYGLGWGSIKVSHVLHGIRQHAYLRTHPLLLGLVSLSAEIYEAGREVRYRGEDLTYAHIRTGRHRYGTVPWVRDTRGIDWAEMSSDVCGSAVNLAIGVMCVRILLRLADFIVEESNAICKGNNQLLKQAGLLQSLQASNTQVSSSARHYKLRAECLIEEAQSLQWRAEILVQTVFTLATQRDQEISIEIAQDSRTLAQQATRDSTSMKSIAAVTMFFLPGTFVASLFAMPMFVWTIQPGRSVSDQFWIYWAVTLPLTLTVFGIWLGWTNREDLKRYFATAKRRTKRRDSESNKSLPEETTPVKNS